MRIRMLKTVSGSPDGGRTLLYRDGEEYALGETEREKELAAVFLREGWAEEVKPEVKPVPPAPPAAPPSSAPSASRLAPQTSGPEKAPDAPPPGGQQHGGKHNRGR